MLSISLTLRGYAIHASDGAIGTVSDFLFDDSNWMVRWLVIDAGSWFTGHRVLIHPSSIVNLDHGSRIVNVRLTKAQISGAPSIASDQPVSQQMQYALYGYYGFDPLWGGDVGAGSYGIGLPSPAMSDQDAAAGEQEGDPHLRSIAAVAGYHIQALDGAIGHIENFLIDEMNWCIRYLVIDTANWWAGKHVLISPHAVSQINWLDHSLDLGLSRPVIQSSPAWLPEEIDQPSYQRLLQDYDGWPGGPAGEARRVVAPQAV